MNEDGNLTLIEVSMFEVQFGLVLSYDVKNYTDLGLGMSPPRPITPSIICTATRPELRKPVKSWKTFSTKLFIFGHFTSCFSFCREGIGIRDLTIRQRQRQWKRRWKIDFASFHFSSWLFQGAQLLKRREFSLQLKRRESARVLTEMVEFIALPFPFPSKLKIWSLHVVVVQGLQRKCTKKRDARAELLFCSLNLLLIWRCRCRRRRSFVRSLLSRNANANMNNEDLPLLLSFGVWSLF